MIRKDAITIFDSDTYAIAKSKNYVIINDGYQGVRVLDNDLKPVTSLCFECALYIYKMFATLKHDKIVIFDAESEALYVVDLLENKRSITRVNSTTIFFGLFLV